MVSEFNWKWLIGKFFNPKQLHQRNIPQSGFSLLPTCPPRPARPELVHSSGEDLDDLHRSATLRNNDSGHKTRRTACRIVLQKRSWTIINNHTSSSLSPIDGNNFFHVIYCERTLTLLALIYFHCLLTDSSFYKTLLVAVLGIFTKDIAAIIILTPPVLQLTSNLSHKRSKGNRNFWKENKLEITLLGLIPVFITCFIYIALIPSSYASKGTYGDPTGFLFSTDARLLILLSMLVIKLGCSRHSLLRPDLLDQINISAVLYAGALGFLAKYASAITWHSPFKPSLSSMSTGYWQKAWAI